MNIKYFEQCIIYKTVYSISINRNMIFDKSCHQLQNVKQLIFDIRIKETLMFGNQIMFYNKLLMETVYITFTALILINWY